MKLAKHRYICDFYLKGLDNKLRYELWCDINKNFTERDREIILDKINNYENIINNQYGLKYDMEMIKSYIKIVSDKFKSINKKLEKHGRQPLFLITEDMVEAMEFRDFLIQFLPEEECSKLLVCKSYEEFQPPLIQKEKDQKQKEH